MYIYPTLYFLYFHPSLHNALPLIFHRNFLKSISPFHHHYPLIIKFIITRHSFKNFLFSTSLEFQRFPSDIHPSSQNFSSLAARKNFSQIFPSNSCDTTLFLYLLPPSLKIGRVFLRFSWWASGIYPALSLSPRENRISVVAEMSRGVPR